MSTSISSTTSEASGRRRHETSPLDAASESAYVRMKALNKWRLRIGWVLSVLVFAIAPRPSLAWLIAGCLLVGVGLMIRMLAASTLTKIDTLTTQGIYALTRNPLYFGSLIIGFGFGALGGQWIWLAVCAILFGWIYRLIIVAEERFLAARYGDAFAAYCHAVPCLFPSILPSLSGAWRDVLKTASLETLRKNNEFRNVKATFAYLLLFAGKLWWLPVGATWWTGRIAP